jgi:hypothetical protein
MMKVTVSWDFHDRRYTIGISRLLQLLELDVTEEQVKQAIIKLLEQEEMTREYSQHK